MENDEVTRQAKREKVQVKGNSFQKVDWTGEISADSLSVLDGAETPLVAQRCSGKLCYGANGLLEAEHVKADALV